MVVRRTSAQPLMHRTALLTGLGRVVAIALFSVGGWAAGAAAAAAPASACNISPGTSTCAPDTLTISSSSTLQSSKTNTISSCITPTPPACFTATYREDVYRDPSPTPVCPTGGCLTWLVQVTSGSNSTDPIARVTISNFKGFKTDMGTTSGGTPSGSGFSSGTVAPNNVNRDGSGSVLAWEFTNTEIVAGQRSVVLEVETNASFVVPGTISFQDATTAQDPALGPTVPDAVWVPALGMLGGGLVGGFAFRRRRARSR